MTGRGCRVAAVAFAALAVASCGTQAEPGPSTDGLSATVDVFAAASLTGTFEQIAGDFETAHPRVRVNLNVGASSSLAQQVVAGAPADVFAAASPAAMAVVTDAGRASGPRVFARNRISIVVPADNPGHVTGLADFAREELKIALCAPEVPCGAAARRVLELSGTRAKPDTLEQDVKAALSKVRLGEADAALVYRTDVLAAGPEVRGIAVPEADQAVSDDELVVLRDAPDAEAAAAFVAYVLSPRGQQVLSDAGFDRA